MIDAFGLLSLTELVTSLTRNRQAGDVAPGRRQSLGRNGPGHVTSMRPNMTDAATSSCACTKLIMLHRRAQLAQPAIGIAYVIRPALPSATSRTCWESASSHERSKLMDAFVISSSPGGISLRVMAYRDPTAWMGM
jgi:hypothetical protein